MSRKDARHYYDQVSSAYDAARFGRYHELADEIAAEEVATAFEESGLVLEAGCGTGRILKKLQALGIPAIGVDISIGMLSKAKQKGFRVVMADLMELPIEPASISMVCSFKVLPHVHDFEGALRSLADSVRPGGKLVIEVYNPSSLRGLVKKFLGARGIVKGVVESDIQTWYHTLSDVENAGKHIGLQVERVRGVRIVTPAARLLDVPFLGSLLEVLEIKLSSGKFTALAGFLIITFRKVA
ncbi:MAG: class I SAM-dependent methyltransferase [Deltaproteobacteria bacterium]|nr:class I SAM-dependent methyltransferase [Deltaproteobacteria bacterium]